MGDYFKHWLEIGKKTSPEKLPKIFFVNWFRKDENGNFIWPGFGDNIRVLKWIFERTENTNNGVESEIGYLPVKGAISGLDISETDINSLFSIQKDKWKAEVKDIEEYFKIFGNRLPEGLKEELINLEGRLG